MNVQKNETIEQVSPEQIDQMKHALGLPRSKKPYRNQFYTETDDKLWNDLVNKGLAKKGGGWEKDYSYFKVTIEGFKMVCKRRITKEMIEDLRLEKGLPEALDSTAPAQAEG